jgi:hypothetical protein
MPALISVGLSLQNAKISFLQIFCYQLTAFSRYAHGVEKQYRWIFLSPSAANRMIIPLRPLLWWFAFANCDSLEKPPSGSILSAPSHQQPISVDHLYNVAGIFLQSHCSARLFFLHDGIVSKKTFIINKPMQSRKTVLK